MLLFLLDFFRHELILTYSIDFDNYMEPCHGLTCQQGVLRGMIDPMMRQYELMVLLKSDFDGENSKKREEIVKKLLGDSATLKEVTSLGKKQLAYPIIKETEAIYLLANVSSEGLKLEDINKRAKLDEQILRFLLLGRGEHGKQKSK